MEQIKIPILAGVTLHYIYTEKFKTSMLAGCFFDTLNTKRASQNAILPYVLLGGCEKYQTRTDLSRQLYHLYGANILPVVKKKGDVQVFGLLTEYIGSKYALAGEDMLDRCANLLCEVLFAPHIVDGGFVKSLVEVEKNNLKDVIDAKINNKREYAYVRCTEIMSENEPYAVGEYGSKQQCETIGHDSLYQYYQKVISSYPIEIYYVGEAPKERVVSILENCIKPFSKNRVLLPQSGISTDVSSKTIIENLEITQSKLAMGFKTKIATDSPQYFPLVMANAVFGVGANAKLFMNVREKLSLCYYVFSRLDKQKGSIVVSAGVDDDKVAQAREEIIRQLDDVKAGNITEKEMQTMKKTLMNAYRALYDSPWELMDFLLGESVCAMPHSVDEYIQSVAGVTMEEAVLSAQAITLDTVYTLSGKGKKVDA